MTLEKTVCYGSGGWYAEVYDTERDMLGRWYGSRAECEAVEAAKVSLHPFTVDDYADDFDLSCERKFD